MGGNVLLAGLQAHACRASPCPPVRHEHHTTASVTQAPLPPVLPQPQLNPCLPACPSESLPPAAFIDTDEFLVLTDSNVSDLPSLLREFEGHGGLAVNWRIFGSSEELCAMAVGAHAGAASCSWDSTVWRVCRTAAVMKPLFAAGLQKITRSTRTTLC